MTITSNTAPMRLTRRGRRLLTAISLAIVLSVSLPALVNMAGASNTSMGNQQLTNWVTVQSGDTLWEIARSISPDRDPREVVWEIKQINALSDGLIAGERIRIPVN
ncbi:MAG: LysM peptidoglycan-binding domain-containing protein [Actinobacteria bacterium]|jgi:hypothetical protein|nr:LysM peptidoglycan-binding domain-containing protein [Actinomycetota bacterium]